MFCCRTHQVSRLCVSSSPEAVQLGWEVPPPAETLHFTEQTCLSAPRHAGILDAEEKP